MPSRAPTIGDSTALPAARTEASSALRPSPTPRPAPGTDLAADLGAALTFAGTALLRNPVVYLVSGAIYTALLLIIVLGGTIGGGIVAFSGSDMWTNPEEFPLTEILIFYGFMLAATVLAYPFSLLWQSGAGRAGEIILEGGRPTLGQALVGPMRIILTALLYVALTVVGMLVCYIPGLIASVLFMFAIPAAARGASPIEALKESASLVRANLGTAIVAYLVLTVVMSIGITVVVGVLVMTPFIVLFELGMYERLKGRQLPLIAKA